MMSIIRIGNELACAEKYFTGTKYQAIVTAADVCLDKLIESEGTDLYESKIKRVKEILEQLPTKEILLKSLVEKLKGKSVYRTLKKIEEGKISTGPDFLKGLFSLGTHVSIEVAAGHKEYRILYPVIYEKLGEVLYNE